MDLMMMFLWIVVGIVSGVLAKKAPQGEGPWGVPGDMILGGVGALAGGWIYQTFYGGWFGSLFVAFVGAAVVLTSLRFAVGPRTA
jgi:uncharacterized membrane protein YeaQ/YmgE (transglycosylase-associated protein family)